MKIGQYRDRVTLDVINLASYDVVLGIPWLTQTAASINCGDRSILIHYKGSDITLRPGSRIHEDVPMLMTQKAFTSVKTLTSGRPRGFDLAPTLPRPPTVRCPRMLLQPGVCLQQCLVRVGAIWGKGHSEAKKGQNKVLKGSSTVPARYRKVPKGKEGQRAFWGACRPLCVLFLRSSYIYIL